MAVAAPLIMHVRILLGVVATVYDYPHPALGHQCVMSINMTFLTPKLLLDLDLKIFH